MKNLIAQKMQTYGVEATFRSSSGVSSRKVFFQPITSKSWQNMERMVPVGGEILRGQYLLITPPDTRIETASSVLINAHTYIIRRIDTIYYQEAPIFLWGLCVEGGEADPWTT